MKEELTVFLPQSFETSGMAECGLRGDQFEAALVNDVSEGALCRFL